jgi:hypothetical protein
MEGLRSIATLQAQQRELDLCQLKHHEEVKQLVHPSLVAAGHRGRECE